MRVTLARVRGLAPSIVAVGRVGLGRVRASLTGLTEGDGVGCSGTSVSRRSESVGRLTGRAEEDGRAVRRHLRIEEEVLGSGRALCLHEPVELGGLGCLLTEHAPAAVRAMSEGASASAERATYSTLGWTSKMGNVLRSDWRYSTARAIIFWPTSGDCLPAAAMILSAWSCSRLSSALHQTRARLRPTCWAHSSAPARSGLTASPARVPQMPSVQPCRSCSWESTAGWVLLSEMRPAAKREQTRRATRYFMLSLMERDEDNILNRNG